MRTTGERRACLFFGSFFKKEKKRKRKRRVESRVRRPGRLFEKKKKREREARSQPPEWGGGAIASFFLFFHGPQFARYARAKRRTKAADELDERDIGTAGILELEKCPETAALGKNGFERDWSTRRSTEVVEKRRRRPRRGNSSASGKKKGHGGRLGSISSPVLPQKSLFFHFRHRRSRQRIETIQRTEGAALRWAAKATCFS